MHIAGALEFAACTDTGQIRPQNEDCLMFDANNGFALLADGMGGYNAGEVASKLAVTLVAKGLQQGLPLLRAAGSDQLNDVALLLRQQIELANLEILREANLNPQYAGMGTTLVGLVFSEHAVLAAHVGDSRLYRLRGGEIERLTRDHTVLQERIDNGEISAELIDSGFHPKTLLTRALGAEPFVAVDLQTVDVKRGDIFLLCSDGLTDMLDEAEIGQVLSRRANDMEEAAKRLVEMANDHGGFDNVSVVVVRAKQSFPAQHDLPSRRMAAA